MCVWLKPCFNLFPPQMRAFKGVSPTLGLLTVLKFNHKQPQDESGSLRVNGGEARAGQGLAGGEGCKHLRVPAKAVWEMLWFHPHNYERWKSSNQLVSSC